MLHIQVAHVEANRILTDYISHLLFAPIVAAFQHLASVGVLAEQVHLVGDVCTTRLCIMARAIH